MRARLTAIEWTGTVVHAVGRVDGMELFSVTRVGGTPYPYRITTKLPLPEQDRPWECRSPEHAREMGAAMLERFVALVTAPTA